MSQVKPNRYVIDTGIYKCYVYASNKLGAIKVASQHGLRPSPAQVKVDTAPWITHMVDGRTVWG